eukprot:TRINITY_DN4598_c0_g1_i2.p1 TRINITY_DN4598_c0_g1~~TRINITY_DN4598_c0_g1_i2.p1  ORF type:complete len:264 (+),score=25.82 TRINITY_DN4598_c0_g1_i2:18-809(+)
MCSSKAIRCSMATSAPVVLHVRHVPCQVLEADLTNAISALGLDAARYDVYFPKQPGRGRKARMSNFGYGFVTCRSQVDADVFTREFQGFQFAHIQSSKKMLVEPTHEQRPMGPRRMRRANGDSETSSDSMGRLQRGSLDSAYGCSSNSFGFEITFGDAEPNSPDLEHLPMRALYPQNNGQDSVCGFFLAGEDGQRAFSDVETVFQAENPRDDSSRTLCSNEAGESSTSPEETDDSCREKTVSPESWELPQTRLVAFATQVCYQ